MNMKVGESVDFQTDTVRWFKVNWYIQLSGQIEYNRKMNIWVYDDKADHNIWVVTERLVPWYHSDFTVAEFSDESSPFSEE